MTVVLDERRATARFDRFGLEEYALFLRAKTLPEKQVAYDWRTDCYEVSGPARFASLLGVEAAPAVGDALSIGEHLFDYQRFIVERALEAKRFAVWADTGLGKTAIFLDWARLVEARTGGRVLILSPLGIIEQTRAEHRLFYGSDVVERIETREQLAAWCDLPGPGIGISNYEKLIPGQLQELRNLAGIVLDESSILKGGGGTIKWNLIHSAKGIEYKLSCTATPAPNDTMEYASQAGFLEKLRNEGEILWTYFTRDKRGVWSVKPHAREAFYRFMASWSIYLRDPAAYGFADILSTLPPPEIHEHELAITEGQRAAMAELLAGEGRGLFDERLGIRERSKLSQIAKGFLYVKGDATRIVESVKPSVVARLADREVRAGRQTIIWTVFDAESELIESAIQDEQALSGHGAPRVGTLHGSDSPEAREETIRTFKAGGLEILITKAQLVGYGLNFQNCRAMVFSGFDDSFERMYQAIRRAYRFGQTETVHVHVPVIPELEGMIFENLRRKQELFERDVAVQERFYREALADDLAEAA